CWWIEGKFLAMPRSAKSRQPYLSIGKKILASAANRTALKSLGFEVKGSGYAAPRSPDQMKPMPKAPDPKNL
ncbi:MAG TPA: hypothetical protein PLP01_16195, partial [Phycisphaerae bacterium]|nr:hypothetical protein [Phycisphaerae bacterium]